MIEIIEKHSRGLFDFLLMEHQYEETESPATSICPEPTRVGAVPSSLVDVLMPGVTSPPELRVRQADCQQIQQSASQAVRDASQSASQSIRQAQQQASDSIRQATDQAQQSAAAATRSATAAIQQASQSAAQSISAASRSASQAMASASSVVASVQSSASDAISRASAEADSARGAQVTAQSAASFAVLQAGAAVAAATGKAAAAGSSFLAAAALATQSAGQVVASQAAIASAQVSQANLNASTSQTVAITATQVAIAIVGSIIASALITILIYFLIAKHKQRVKKRSQTQSQPMSDPKSPDTARAFEAARGFSRDSKFPVADQQAPTISGSRPGTSGTAMRVQSPVSLSLFPKVDDNPAGPRSPIRSTSVKWNPSQPPKPPSLGTWLKLQDTVSPFGPIRLPSEDKPTAPLGGQLKSPLQSKRTKATSPQAPRFVSNLPPRDPKIPKLTYRTPKTPVVADRQPSVQIIPTSPNVPEVVDDEKENGSKNRESKASVWTDDIVLDEQSAARTVNPPTLTQSVSMQLPIINKPVRTTAEWLMDQQNTKPPGSARSLAISQQTNRPPSAVSVSRTPSFRGGLPGNPRSHKSMKATGFTPGSGTRENSRYSRYSEAATPGVGKAL